MSDSPVITKYSKTSEMRGLFIQTVEMIELIFYGIFNFFKTPSKVIGRFEILNAQSTSFEWILQN